MPRIRFRGPRAFEEAFADVRAELDVPTRFPDDVLAEAEAATLDAGHGGTAVERRDARDLPLVAVDPPGATDLDQAFTAERRGDGYRVNYAIADVGAFLSPGGAVDTEARRRGATLYSPDTRTPLHPPIISEDRASLLAGTEKPALLWTIDLDGDGNPISDHLERAMVRVTEAIAYREAQRRVADGSDERMSLLSTIGGLRQAREAERGGVSLNLPAQEVVQAGDSWALAFDEQLPIEGWNAQISLLTGIVGGRRMLDAGVGVLRTLPPVQDDAVDRLRRTARAVDVDWPDDEPYAAFVRRIEPDTASRNAFLLQAARAFRGAGYVGFDGERPKHAEHGAIASVYAHITAPLRRLVDRFGNEILLALHADQEPPAWAVEALDELPSLMGRARQRESALERAMLDMAEALVLEHCVGKTFDGSVVDINERRRQARVQITDPAIVDTVPADGRTLGERVTLRVDRVDTAERRVDFSVVD
ncbi:MAG: RNB domain-containing ribonuclease [Actinomycetota bacterium]